MMFTLILAYAHGLTVETKVPSAEVARYSCRTPLAYYPYYPVLPVYVVYMYRIKRGMSGEIHLNTGLVG